MKNGFSFGLEEDILMKKQKHIPYQPNPARVLEVF